MNHLDELKKKINIKYLIEKETGLSSKKINKNYRLENCPIPGCGSGTGHNRTSAFTIYPKSFYCFSCKNGGSQIDFIMYLKGLNYDQAIQYLKDNYLDSSKFQELENNKTVDIGSIINAIKKNPVDKAIAYLQGRGIKTDSFKDSWYYDNYKDAVCFIDTENKLLNWRRIKNSEKGNAKGSIIKNSIYDRNYRGELETVFLCESPINSLSLAGYSAISIFTTGNRFTDKEKLKKYVSGKTVILAFDPDRAGDDCTKYYQKLLKDSFFEVIEIKKLILSEGKDINDLCQAKTLEKHIENPDNYSILWKSEPDIILKPIHADSEDPNEDFALYRYFKKSGCYFTKEFKGKNYVEVKESNFVMEILYHFVDGTNNTKRLIKIQRYTGEIKTVEVLSSETKKEIFETILKSHNCTFLGNTYTLNSIFAHLMDNQIEAYAIDKLGYISEHKVYVFSDSLLNNENKLIRANQIGIVQDRNKHFYLPAWSNSNIDNKAFENARKFRFKPGELNFAEWSTLIYQAYGINGGIGICFMINSLFRDIVFSELNFFPYLFLFGQAGVGKSSYIDFFLRLFGDKDVGTSIKTSSVKGIARTATQRKNAIVFLKEYDSAISPEMNAFLKNAYDGAAYTIAQKTTDNKTEAFLIESGILIDGNVLPTSESALFDRMIILTFERDTFSESETKAYKTLIDQSDKGFGNILIEILSLRDEFRKQYKTAYRGTYDELKFGNTVFLGVNIGQLPERTLRHIAFLFASYKILFDKLAFPFDYLEITKKIVQDAIQKTILLLELKDVSIFWDAISYDRQTLYPIVQENTHYQKDYLECILYIKLKDVFPVYIDYCRKNKILSVDKATLLSLLISKKEGFIPSSQKNRNNTFYRKDFGNCYRFAFTKTSNEKIILINEKEVYL